MATTEHSTELAVEVIGATANVRAGDVTEGEDFASLVASVTERGVLVPILVTEGHRDDDRQFVCVDGHRRLAAARAAGLERIPARMVETDDAADASVLAMVANVRRLNLGPVEEADAYVGILEAKGWTQKRLAASLGVSPQLVAGRLKLARLPAGVRDQVTAGAVTLAAVPALEKVAEIAPVVAEAAVALDEGERLRNEDDVVEVLRHLAWSRGVDGPFVAEIRTAGYSLRALGLDESRHPKLAKQWKDKVGGGYNELTLAAADEQLTDAARAFGCLVEIDDRAFVTDETWWADRVAAALDAYTPPKRAGAAAADEPADDAEAQKKAKAREREKERKERLAAGARNRELEQVLRVALSNPDEITPEVARLVAAAAIAELSPGRVGFVFDELHTVTTTGTGDKRREKTATKPIDEIVAWVVDWVLAAEQPSQVLGRAAAVLLAGYLADDAVVPQSQRPYEPGHAREPANRVLAAAPDEVAPVLVAGFKKRLGWLLSKGGED